MSELIKASQNNASGTIYYLPSLLYMISILNLCKYLDAQINLKFSLSVEKVESDVYLAIPNTTS